MSTTSDIASKRPFTAPCRNYAKPWLANANKSKLKKSRVRVPLTHSPPKALRPRTTARCRRKAKKIPRPPQRSQQQMDALREKFVQRALSYQGVPYHSKYWPAGSEHHNAPLFLDCCGLVRRVLRDLKEDFGFVIGKWNQAYQFDTLPLTLRGPEEMRRGDLVFVSGKYFNRRKKRQIHDKVHLEIWLGDGERTLGARLQRGLLCTHDSYQYVSKGYGNMKYHFCSIDTWLQGICKSHCGKHVWRKNAYK